MAVSRFSSPNAGDEFRRHNIETIRADLLVQEQLDSIPQAPNVVYMAGMKFGSTGQEGLTWAMNAYLPGMVCQRFRRSRIGDVADHSGTADLGGNGFGEFGVEVAHGNPGALRRQPPRGRRAQSGCAAGDDGGLVLQLHGALPDKLSYEFGYSVTTCAGGAGE